MVGNRSRRALLAVLVTVLATLLGGCLNVNAALTISGEDTVSGEVVVATETVDGKVPFELRPPPKLADRVKVEPFTEGQEAGATVSFRDLEFDEVGQLAAALSPNDSRYHLELRRQGSLVHFEGEADLTPLAETDSSIELKISAPGEITRTNGEESAGTVTWNLEPGEVTQLSAAFQFSGAGGLGWWLWVSLVGGLTVLTAVLVGLLALRTHLRNRPPVKA
ncbi:DUF3153 domain-containing protein [Saccharopolyspora griseoalba]|uniref:DUF3153 domain-containing protein n=1 Tax=Saccharopolyspora griseoalba TaxID=1431848 RepID=A0ABW2LNH7_9PSEU